jgi:adenylate cyclase
VIAGGAWWLLNANQPASVATKAPAEAARLSIVALPFANLSGDPGQDYLVDALTDELTTALARIRGAFVIARNTAFTYKGKPVDAKAIGKDLGVRYVVEGSVQPSGDRMRVNAQLIDAGSGLTSGPNNSTRPAPICCRRRTQSSRIWRDRCNCN